jgi:type I restriction enzyme S subunit
MSLLEADPGSKRRWTRVGDCYEVTKKPRSLDRFSVSEVPFAAMEAIPQDGTYAPIFTVKPSSAITSGTYFERRDILIAKITPSFENGKQALALDLPSPFGYATTEVIPLHAREPQHDPRLLFFYLLHPDIRYHVAERMEGTTGRQRVPENVLLDLPMPALGGDEQTAMADALEVIRHASATETQCELAAQNLKRAAMRELFTRGLRGAAQKETEIGPVPESWSVVGFASVREWLQYGTSSRCTYEPTKFPVLRIPNIEPGRVNTKDLKFGTPSPSEAARYELKDGDLIFIRTNGVIERLGACAVFGGEPRNALFASYLIRARLRLEKIDPYFASYFFGSELGTSIVVGRATPASDGKYNLNTGTIDSLPIPLPPTLEEQREIVGILDAIDRKIDLHRKKRAVLDELFKALLHKLMTGEIGVGDLDLSALDHPAAASTVIPAQAGIQGYETPSVALDPRFRGGDEKRVEPAG